MNQSEKRLFLIQSLLNERPSCHRQPIPAAAERQKILLRGLMNVRRAYPIGADFLRVQDEYLKGETAVKGVTDVADLTPVQPELYLWQGDITTLKCDAIVNAAPEPFKPFRKRFRQDLSSNRPTSADTCGWALYIVSNSCTSKAK